MSTTERICRECKKLFRPPPSHLSNVRCGTCLHKAWRSRRSPEKRRIDSIRRNERAKRFRAKLSPEERNVRNHRNNQLAKSTPQKRRKRNQSESKRINSRPLEKLASRLRQRFGKAVRRNSKQGSAVRDLGCTIEEFRSYIESLFRPGMTWENWGKWHLDHKRPLSSFDLEDRSQFLQAAHYTNYQPLWAEDNINKGARLLVPV